MMCVNREIWIVTREAGSRSTSYIQRLLHDMCVRIVTREAGSRSTSYIQRLLHDMCVRIVTREAGFVKLLTCFVENAK